LCKTKYFRESWQVIPLSSILCWLFFTHQSSLIENPKWKTYNSPVHTWPWLLLYSIFKEFDWQRSLLLSNPVFVGAQSAPPSFETELHSHNEAGALSLPLSFPLYYNVPCEMRTKREKLDSKFLYYFKESCRVHLYPFRRREEMKLLASYVVTQLYCLSAKQHNLIHVPISSKNSNDY